VDKRFYAIDVPPEQHARRDLAILGASIFQRFIITLLLDEF